MSMVLISGLLFFIGLIIILICCEVMTYFIECEGCIFNDKESLEDAINNNVDLYLRYCKIIHFKDHKIYKVDKCSSILFKYYLIDCNLNYYGIYRWGKSCKIIDSYFKSLPRETYINTRLFN